MTAAAASPRFARLGSNLTVRVLVAIALGVAVGVLWPSVGRALKPVGDTFVNLVRMVIAPVIFSPSCSASPTRRT